MMLEVVAVETVCFGLGVFWTWCVREGRVSSFEVKVGNFWKRRGKRGFVGILGEGIWEGKGKQNRIRCRGFSRTMRKTCGMMRGDNGCAALSWKCESARLAHFKVVESRVRHLCWDRQVGSQPMEANIRPCEYT